jgi:triacylglycerol lipase
MAESFDFNASTTRYHPRNAYWLGRCAALAYEAPDRAVPVFNGWGFDRVRFLDTKDTQGYVIGSRALVIVAFRGTEPDRLKDWKANADAQFDPGPFGRVHRGFQRALRHLWEDMGLTIGAFQDAGQAIFFTGHSLGAALATLAVAHMRAAPNDKPVYGLYTFGSPRVGDREFEQRFNQDFGRRCFRFVNNNDLVTRVPPRAVGFSHVGTMLYFDRKGRLQDDPAWWYRFVDSVKAGALDLGELGPDALKDHGMAAGYLANLERNGDVDPFA